MEIVYSEDALQYEGARDFEGSYRLEGIGEIGKMVNASVSEGEQLAALVHTPRHIRKVRERCKYGTTFAEIDTTSETYKAACAAVSVAVLAAKEGHFAAIRPPGHHASREVAAGFCFFNNVAIASTYLLNLGRRVCILDIDGHQGDGTERIFESDGRVLYWSIHQNTSRERNGSVERDTSASRRGHGKGRGLIYNVPLSRGSGDDTFISKAEEFMPLMQQFNPDVIAVSAGFDSHMNDKLLDLEFTERGYEQFGRLIGSQGKKVFCVLEGGYHRSVVSCIDHLVRGINSAQNSH